MTSALTTVTDRQATLRDSGLRLSGRTASEAKGMTSRDERTLVVDRNSEGRYAIKLNAPNGAFEIRDRSNNVVAYGRNGGAAQNVSTYLSSGEYKVRVLDDESAGKSNDYSLDITPRAPETVKTLDRTGGRISGKTEQEGYRGMPADTKMVTVSQGGAYNFRLNTPYTSFEVRNARGDVVAAGNTQITPEAVKVNMAANEIYTVTVTQKNRTSFGRGYDLDVSQHINANIMGTGGMVIGNAEDKNTPIGGIGKQTHTVNFLADGNYSLNFLASNTKYTITDASGKEVATAKNGAVPDLPIDAEIKAGAYKLTIEPDIGAGSSWILNISNPEAKRALERNEVSEVTKLLQERDARMAKWRAQGSAVNIKA